MGETGPTLQPLKSGATSFLCTNTHRHTHTVMKREDGLMCDLLYLTITHSQGYSGCTNADAPLNKREYTRVNASYWFIQYIQNCTQLTALVGSSLCDQSDRPLLEGMHVMSPYTEVTASLLLQEIDRKMSAGKQSWTIRMHYCGLLFCSSV